MEQTSDLRTVMKTHRQKYPLMQLQDYYKLLYQNEFGGGHLVSDSKAALIWFMKEWNSNEAGIDKEELVEDIGNGFCRLNLRPASKSGLLPDAAFNAFLISAGMLQGDSSCFKNKLLLLKEITEAGTELFKIEELQQFIDEYAEKGFPMVSHSEIYRKTYRPSYRVIKVEYIHKLLVLP